MDFLSEVGRDGWCGHFRPVAAVLSGARRLPLPWGGAGGCGFEVYGAWEVGAEGGDISSKLGVAGFRVLL